MSVKSILEIINSKVGFPHVLVKTSEIVVIVGKHSVAWRINSVKKYINLINFIHLPSVRRY